MRRTEPVIQSHGIGKILSAAIFVLTVIIAVQAQDAAASDCGFIKGLEDGSRFRCGKAEVPEDHFKPEGRRISIAYLIVPARSKPKRPDPVIYFSGGPGGGSLGPGFINFLAGSLLAEKRDLVFFDQRGIQYSSALPDIGLGVYTAMAADTDMEGERKMIAAVLDSYRKKADAAGIDLGAYNSLQNARDAAALMKKLG